MAIFVLKLLPFMFMVFTGAVYNVAMNGERFSAWEGFV